MNEIIKLIRSIRFSKSFKLSILVLRINMFKCMIEVIIYKIIGFKLFNQTGIKKKFKINKQIVILNC